MTTLFSVIIITATVLAVVIAMVIAVVIGLVEALKFLLWVGIVILIIGVIGWLLRRISGQRS